MYRSFTRLAGANWREAIKADSLNDKQSHFVGLQAGPHLEVTIVPDNSAKPSDSLEPEPSGLKRREIFT